MPDASDYFRGYARDIGVDPPVGGATNVQDALGAGSGGVGNNFIMANQDGSATLTTSEVPVAWTVETTEGTPGFELDVDTETWNCTATGLYVIYAEPVFAYTPDVSGISTVTGIQADVYLRPLIADDNGLANFLNLHWTYDFLPSMVILGGAIGPAIAALNYESYTTPPLAFAAGDTFHISAQVLVPGDSSDQVVSTAAHAIAVCKVG